MPIVPLDPGPDMARSLAQHIDQFLARLPPSVGGDRRDVERLAIPLLLQIRPVDGCEADQFQTPATAVGKDLSRSGLGMFHREPIPHRHVIVTFEDPRLERLSIEVELNRCRFSNFGWYESGGRLLRIVEPASPASLAG